MKYLAAFILSVLSIIGLRQLAQAETNVNVSNTTDGGSNTHVVVNSNVNSSSNTTSTVNSNTKVHIESNGEVKDFETNGDQTVDWQSSDGKSSVKINNNSVKGTSTKVTPTPDKDGDEDADPTITPSEHQSSTSAKKIVKAITTHRFSLGDFFKQLFALLGFASHK